MRVECIYFKSHSTSTAVPEGSQLGPTLLVVFINDLTAVQISQTDLYTEMRSSTRLSRKKSFRKECTVSRQACRLHRLGPSPGEAVSQDRCSSAWQPCQNACQQFPLSIDEENIDIVDTHKHLGVILSSDSSGRPTFSPSSLKLVSELDYIATRPCVPPTPTCPGKAYMSPAYNVCETNDGVYLSSVAQQCKGSRCSRPGAGSSKCSPHYRGCRLGHAQRHPSSSTGLAIALVATNHSEHDPLHQLVHRGEEPLAECMFQLSLATGCSIRKPQGPTPVDLGMASSTQR